MTATITLYCDVIHHSYCCQLCIVYLWCVCVCSYPDLKSQYMLSAHPANCICIEFEPTGKYFATGSADALVSLWDVSELVCMRTLARYV